MTKSLTSALLTSLCVLALATTGCISTRETVYSDVERTPVTFASDKAGRVFYEALARAPESTQRTEKRTEVSLILINVDHRTIAGPNRLFNEAVAFCDTNRDGAITEPEAEIFANAWRPVKA